MTRKWVKTSDILPHIPEEIELWDGHNIYPGYAWDSFLGGTELSLSDEKYDDEKDIVFTHWRPLEGSALHLAFDENTHKVREPVDDN